MELLDAIGQLTKVTDDLGNATDYEYNNRGWLTKVKHPDPDGAGPLSRPEDTYGYDAAGRLTSRGMLAADLPREQERHRHGANDRRFFECLGHARHDGH